MTMEEREEKRKQAENSSVVRHIIRDPVSKERGRPTTEAETKTRISVTISPSLHEDIKKITYVERISVSRLISDLLETYRAQHVSEVEEYDDLVK